MQFYQLALLDDLTEPPPPTIGSLEQGKCFLRSGARRDKFVYMVVSICGDIRYELKDADGRNMLIINLVTGRVFSARSEEVITPLPYAAIVEDIVKQLKKGTVK